MNIEGGEKYVCANRWAVYIYYNGQFSSAISICYWFFFFCGKERINAINIVLESTRLSVNVNHFAPLKRITVYFFFLIVPFILFSPFLKRKPSTTSTTPTAMPPASSFLWRWWIVSMYTCSIHKIPSSSFHSNFTQKNIRRAEDFLIALLLRRNKSEIKKLVSRESYAEKECSSSRNSHEHGLCSYGVFQC